MQSFFYQGGLSYLFTQTPCHLYKKHNKHFIFPPNVLLLFIDHENIVSPHSPPPTPLLRSARTERGGVSDVERRRRRLRALFLLLRPPPISILLPYKPVINDSPPPPHSSSSSSAPMIN